jgi:predicted nuclease of restriction endonuclease-like (RecB) superfamily
VAKKRKQELISVQADAYDSLLNGIGALLERARTVTVRTVNGILSATYYEIGRRIVEFEQGGQEKAAYGEALLRLLGRDLSTKYGRGFSQQGLYKMRGFYLGWQIFSTASGKLQARVKCALSASEDTSGEQIFPTVSGKLQTVTPLLVPLDYAATPAELFPLPWSHYVRLMSVKDDFARAFYEEEAIRGGWSVRQLDRQISTQFYERTALSKNKAAMLRKGEVPKPEDAVPVVETIRDPYLLEFLDLKDEYGESELEEAIIRHLETFLLEMGGGFTFVARQKRIRIGDEWYRIDLLLFHRRLRCLVVIDLKLGKFSHADAGQMNLYLNYAREHLTEAGESDPVGLILCSDKDDAVVKYATGGHSGQGVCVPVSDRLAR